MRTIRNNKGVSTILIALMLGAGLLVLFVSIGNDFNSLNKATVDLKEYSNEAGASYDIGQMLINSYQKSQAAGGVCDTANSNQYTPEGTTTFSLCMPKTVANAGFCSQSNAKYCVANPPKLVAIYEGSIPDYVVKLNFDKPVLPKDFKTVGRLLLGNQAMATEVWLPTIPVAPPASLFIAVPNCLTGAGLGAQDCIRCGVNANCLKVKICNNRTSTCPDSGVEYIEPVFAFQFAYP